MSPSPILMAFESSCDDSSVALVDTARCRLIDVLTYSQDIHKLFGGVVPELASRDHLKKIPILLDKILCRNKLSINDLGYLACTYKPGLIGSLLMGLMTVKSISYFLNIRFVGVDHLYGHIFADFWDHKVGFPFIAMVISGGHSDMFLVRDYTDISRIGNTVDDAAGEILDKIAKELGLGYPGGPEVEKYAEAYQEKECLFELPVPMKNKDNYNLSFSGLKTACYLIIRDQKAKGELSGQFISKLCYSLLYTVSKAICIKARKALNELEIDKLVIGGGVMRNSIIKAHLFQNFNGTGTRLHIPGPGFCTDNAAMVGYLGMIYCQRGIFSDHTLNAFPCHEAEDLK